MKSVVVIGLIVLSCTCIYRLKSPVATLTFRAMTDSGEPVVGAEITMTIFVGWQRGEGFGQDIHTGSTGKTDSTGMVKLSVLSSRGKIHNRGR